MFQDILNLSENCSLGPLKKIGVLVDRTSPCDKSSKMTLDLVAKTSSQLYPIGKNGEETMYTSPNGCIKYKYKRTNCRYLISLWKDNISYCCAQWKVFYIKGHSYYYYYCNLKIPYPSKLWINVCRYITLLASSYFFNKGSILGGLRLSHDLEIDEWYKLEILTIGRHDFNEMIWFGQNILS